MADIVTSWRNIIYVDDILKDCTLEIASILDHCLYHSHIFLGIFSGFAVPIVAIERLRDSITNLRARKFENSTSGCSPWAPIMHNIGITSP